MFIDLDLEVFFFTCWRGDIQDKCECNATRVCVSSQQKPECLEFVQMDTHTDLNKTLVVDQGDLLNDLGAFWPTNSI